MISASTQQAFEQLYPTEESCIDALEKHRWPDGFRCLYCGNSHACIIRTRRLPLYQCSSCRHQTSLIAGTAMEGSRTELRKWFQAFYFVSSHPNSINAVQLADLIAVTYKTAWLMLAKIRYALNESDHGKLLSSLVCANLADAGPSDPLRFRSDKLQRYPLFAGGEYNSQNDNRASIAPSLYTAMPARIKIKLLPPHTYKNGNVIPALARQAFADAHAESSASLQFSLFRYGPKRYLPLVQAANNASCWMYRKFCGVSFKHMQAYLDEFCFRFNQALSTSTNTATNQILAIITRIPRLTYREITRTTAVSQRQAA